MDKSFFRLWRWFLLDFANINKCVPKNNEGDSLQGVLQ